MFATFINNNECSFYYYLNLFDLSSTTFHVPLKAEQKLGHANYKSHFVGQIQVCACRIQGISKIPNRLVAKAKRQLIWLILLEF